MLWLALLVGCMPGPNEETVIDDLRIVAAVAEPPEVTPEEPSTVTLHIADPLGLEPDVLTWTCTRTGPECAERALPLDQRSWELALDDGTASLPLPPPSGLSTVASETPIPVEVWSLACEPGACDIVERWRSAVPGTGLAEQVAIDLESPAELLEGVDFEQAALAVKRVYVSTRPVDQRATNPTIEPLGSDDPDEDGAVRMSFSVEASGEASIWGYATVGGFGSPSAPAEVGPAELDYFPAGADTAVGGELYVVAVQADGGSAVWRGPAPGPE